MNYAEYKFLVCSDLYRITGSVSRKLFLRQLLWGEGFKVCFWVRTCRFIHANRVLKVAFFRLAWLILRHYKYSLGISVPFNTEIGSGFYIGHFGNIFVSGNAVIGRNCNISQEVTIGIKTRGAKKGVPKIGHNVYIGPGAKIIGAINVGDYAAIGANCVVTKDVPDHAVVVGVPGRVISYAGSDGYVNRTDYPDFGCPAARHE